MADPITRACKPLVCGAYPSSGYPPASGPYGLLVRLEQHQWANNTANRPVRPTRTARSARASFGEGWTDGSGGISTPRARKDAPKSPEKGNWSSGSLERSSPCYPDTPSSATLHSTLVRRSRERELGPSTSYRPGGDSSRSGRIEPARVAWPLLAACRDVDSLGKQRSRRNQDKEGRSAPRLSI